MFENNVRFSSVTSNSASASGTRVKSVTAPNTRNTAAGGGYFSSGTTQPQRSAKRRHEVKADLHVARLSTTRMSSTQCSPAISKRTAGALQHHVGIRAKLIGADLPPNHCATAKPNTGLDSSLLYITTFAQAVAGSADCGLYAFEKSEVKPENDIAAKYRSQSVPARPTCPGRLGCECACSRPWNSGSLRAYRRCS